MGSGITLHREHGLNPTMPVCAYCGESKQTIALLGASYKGKAPMKMILDLEPCDTCKSNMSKGITFVEVNSEEERIPQGYIVVSEEYFKHVFKDEDFFEKVLEKRVIHVPKGFVKQVMGYDMETKLFTRDFPRTNDGKIQS